MYCPKCNAFLNERDTIKSNMISTSDGVIIEYDARCPNCSVMIGRVVWGHLTIAPEFREKTVPAAPRPPDEKAEQLQPEGAVSRQPEPAPAVLPEQKRTTLDDLLADIKPITDYPAPKRCPHCGKDLPLDF